MEELRDRIKYKGIFRKQDYYYLDDIGIITNKVKKIRNQE